MKDSRVRRLFDKAEAMLSRGSEKHDADPVALAIAGLGMAILAAIAKDLRRDFDEDAP